MDSLQFLSYAHRISWAQHHLTKLEGERRSANQVLLSECTYSSVRQTKSQDLAQLSSELTCCLAIHSATSTSLKRTKCPTFTYGIRRSATSRRTWR
jgi:hypothetical protein